MDLLSFSRLVSPPSRAYLLQFDLPGMTDRSRDAATSTSSTGCASNGADSAGAQTERTLRSLDLKRGLRGGDVSPASPPVTDSLEILTARVFTLWHDLDEDTTIPASEIEITMRDQVPSDLYSLNGTGRSSVSGPAGITSRSGTDREPSSFGSDPDPMLTPLSSAADFSCSYASYTPAHAIPSPSRRRSRRDSALTKERKASIGSVAHTPVEGERSRRRRSAAPLSEKRLRGASMRSRSVEVDSANVESNSSRTAIGAPCDNDDDDDDSPLMYSDGRPPPSSSNPLTASSQKRPREMSLTPLKLNSVRSRKGKGAFGLGMPFANGIIQTLAMFGGGGGGQAAASGANTGRARSRSRADVDSGSNSDAKSNRRRSVGAPEPRSRRNTMSTGGSNGKAPQDTELLAISGRIRHSNRSIRKSAPLTDRTTARPPPFILKMAPPSIAIPIADEVDGVTSSSGSNRRTHAPTTLKSAGGSGSSSITSSAFAYRVVGNVNPSVSFRSRALVDPRPASLQPGRIRFPSPPSIASMNGSNDVIMKGGSGTFREGHRSLTFPALVVRSHRDDGYSASIVNDMVVDREGALTPTSELTSRDYDSSSDTDTVRLSSSSDDTDPLDSRTSGSPNSVFSLHRVGDDDDAPLEWDASHACCLLKRCTLPEEGRVMPIASSLLTSTVPAAITVRYAREIDAVCGGISRTLRAWPQPRWYNRSDRIRGAK